MYPTTEQVIELHRKYAASEKAYSIVFNHCSIVWEIAQQLIAAKNLPVDTELVRIGCLLHDIGAYKLIDIDGVFDTSNYITHGIKGHDMLETENVSDAFCRIAERHTGVGITTNQILRDKLPLPPKDYVAETLEEELVMYADKFHSKNPKFNSFESYCATVRKFGPELETKFKEFSEKFGIPDLQQLAERHGQVIA